MGELKEKRNLNEIVVLRAIACLCVVMLHAIKHVIYNNYGETLNEGILLNIVGLLSFGTPAFVFISIILFAYKYPNALPDNFYKKRVIAILIPFITMAIFYAVVESNNNISDIPKVLAYNLMGYYHGWFVLVIFQFYILYHLFTKIGDKISPIPTLLVSFLINILYLGYFNFTESYNNSEFALFIWSQGFWIPFTGWIFYFTFAYYFGKNYEKILDLVEKYKIFVMGALLVSILIIMINNYFSLFQYGSKRIDMIFFTVCIVILILQSTSKLKNINWLINIISKYSFGIYLLHMFYLLLFMKIYKELDIHPGYWSIPLCFLGSVVASIISVNLLNRLRFGKYLVGGVNNKSFTKREDLQSHNNTKVTTP